MKGEWGNGEDGPGFGLSELVSCRRGGKLQRYSGNVGEVLVGYMLSYSRHRPEGERLDTGCLSGS